MNDILKVENLTRSYPSAGGMLTVLHDVSFKINVGTVNAIIGSSGSGKSTLLGLCAGLDRPSSGKVVLCDNLLNDLNEDRRAFIRNQHVGFVFQNFQLIPTLTALENVMTPLEIRGEKNAESQAKTWLDRVGLGERFGHYPSMLSGGEQQRVAIARAFANRPQILFADEPTGNLDEETGAKVEQLLFDLNKDSRITLLIVTHDPELARKTQRILHLKGGKLISDETN